MWKKVFIILVIVSLLIWAYILVTSVVNTDNKEITAINSQSSIQSLELIAQSASPSVVSIIIKTRMNIYRSDPYNFFEQIVWRTDVESGLWSGFFISDDWYIITSKHVVDNSDAEYIVVLQNGEQFSSRVVYIDRDSDIALIKINSDSHIFQPLKIQAPKNIIEIWETVVAIWNTLSENDNTISFGTITGVNWFLETDILLFPWNSWGPLVNIHWKVIGVNTAIDWSQDNISLATQINSEMIEIYLSSVK